MNAQQDSVNGCILKNGRALIAESHQGQELQK